MAKSRGAPPKPPEERLDAKVQVRCTELEKQQMAEAAGGLGKVSSWARKILLRAAKAVRKKEK